MKSVFKLLTIISIAALLIVSCGGSGSGLVGKWHVDLSSLDLVLGEGVPAPMKAMVEGQKDGLVKQGEEQSDDVTIEFTEAGKVILSKVGEEKTEEMDYTFDGSKLNLSGDMEGEKVNVDLNISEVSGDKFTVSMTAEEILAQVKEKYPDALRGTEGMNIEEMAKGSSMSISFKK